MTSSLLTAITGQPFLITMATVIPSLILGVFVVFRGRREQTHAFFFAACMLIIVWGMANFFSLQAQSSLAILRWARIVLLLAVFLSFAFYLFLKTFGQREKALNKKKIALLATLALLTACATQTPYIFSSISFKNDQPVPEVGTLIPLLGFTIFTFFLLSTLEIISRLRKSKGIERTQFIYIGVGYFIMFFLLISTQFILASFFQNTSLIKYGPIFTLPFLGFAAYAIFRHHLFNVRVFATEALATTIIAIFFINIFFADSPGVLLRNVVLFVTMFLLAVFLVRSVLKEIKQREQIQSLASDLRVANVRLQQLDKAKTEFLSIASHQLRSPMTSIKGYMSMLSTGDYGKLNSKQEKVIGSVAENTESLIQLVNLFLDITRIEEGRFDLSPAKIDMGELSQDVVGQLTPQAKTHNLDLNYIAPKSKPGIAEVDKEKIRQVVLNLIDNAVKYTPKGSVTVTLHVNASPLEAPSGLPSSISRGKIQGERVSIYVSDTGIGLSQEDIDQLYQKFFRVKKAVQAFTGGSGLGLFVAKKIVELHGGDLGVWSAGRGKGSTFAFSVPVKLSQEVIKEAAKSAIGLKKKPLSAA